MIDYIFPLEMIKETAFKAPLPIQNEIKAILPRKLQIYIFAACR